MLVRALLEAERDEARATALLARILCADHLGSASLRRALLDGPGEIQDGHPGPELNNLLDRALRWPDLTERTWEAVRGEVLAGRREGLDDAHDWLEQIIQNRQTSLLWCLEIVRELNRFRATRLKPAPYEIAMDELLDLRKRALTGWKTLEELEDRLAAEFELPSSELDKLGARFAPDPKWYKDDTKPF